MIEHCVERGSTYHLDPPVKPSQQEFEQRRRKMDEGEAIGVFDDPILEGKRFNQMDPIESYTNSDDELWDDVDSSCKRQKVEPHGLPGSSRERAISVSSTSSSFRCSPEDSPFGGRSTNRTTTSVAPSSTHRGGTSFSPSMAPPVFGRGTLQLKPSSKGTNLLQPASIYAITAKQVQTAPSITERQQAEWAEEKAGLVKEYEQILKAANERAEKADSERMEASTAYGRHTEIMAQQINQLPPAVERLESEKQDLKDKWDTELKRAINKDERNTHSREKTAKDSLERVKMDLRSEKDKNEALEGKMLEQAKESEDRVAGLRNELTAERAKTTKEREERAREGQQYRDEINKLRIHAAGARRDHMERISKLEKELVGWKANGYQTKIQELETRLQQSTRQKTSLEQKNQALQDQVKQFQRENEQMESLWARLEVLTKTRRDINHPDGRS